MKINIFVQFICIVNAGREILRNIYIVSQQKDKTHYVNVIVITLHAKTNITTYMAALNRQFLLV